MIREADRPLLFVYIHGWQNNAESGDVCRFEHFLDSVSRFPAITGRKINVIDVYIAWRGVDLNLPVFKFLTFWNRKSAGSTIAAQNGCLATLSELALAARAPDKTYHFCVLLGHSFGGLVLRTQFLIPFLTPAALVRAIPVHGTWPWRLIRPITLSAAGN